MSMCGRIEDLEAELKSIQDASPCKSVCFIGPSGNCEACFRSVSDIQETGKRVMEIQKKLKELKKW